ncbi:Uncharacterized protein FWK35_00013063 [Aphis craccivora]|uniref:Uncharacterized protein n=1 Tax=Aphis craccivora TaxID=307492 RepID=A0A6G0Y883_APHCR|nr:Uncharacterized protein FWK35_00013063 [Aphis craccivora]
MLTSFNIENSISFKVDEISGKSTPTSVKFPNDPVANKDKVSPLYPVRGRGAIKIICSDEIGISGVSLIEDTVTEGPLRLAKKFAYSNNTEKLMSMLNTTTLEFFKSQIKSQTKKPKGRQYSLNDKILSLSLYKNSPKGYSFLSTILLYYPKKH